MTQDEAMKKAEEDRLEEAREYQRYIDFLEKSVDDATTGLLDRFAGEAMNGILISERIEGIGRDPKAVSAFAYRIAIAMMKTRSDLLPVTPEFKFQRKREGESR